MCATRKVFGWGLVIWLACSFAAVSAAQVTVRWAEYPRAGMDDFKRLATERFNARYPDIRVVYEPVTDATKLTVAMAGGTAPDVVTWWTDTLQGWGESGLIIDLDPFVKRDLSEADLADFNPGQMKAFRLGSGYLYALPLFGGTWATWFNADKFDEAGVPRPSSDWNWDALVATARKLTRYDGNQVVQWGVQAAMNLERMTPFLRQNGAELHPDGDNSACLLNQPAAVTAIDFVAGLIHRHNVMPIGGFEGVEAFKAGKVALEFEGSWAVNWYLSLTEYRLGLVEPPRGPVARSSIVAFEGYGITRNSANTDAAWQWLKFLTSRDANEMRALTLGLQPARRSAAMVWFGRLRETYPGAADTNLDAFLQAWSYAAPQPMYSDQRIAAPLLEAGLVRILRRGELAQTVLDEVVPAVNAALAQAKDR
jgi:ABC-type glycerol-3-phosphate transport system substrate-binding protein